MKKMSDLLKGTFSVEQTQTGNMSIRDFLRLIENWQQLLKGFIAENTLPHRIKGRDLYVATLHPTLAQELTFMERDILIKILKNFPEWTNKLGRLHFKYYPGFKIQEYMKSLKNGETQQPSKQVVVKNMTPDLSPLQKFQLKSSSQNIEDSEIKKLLDSLIDKL